MIETNYTLDVAFDELTKEIEKVIGEEVHKFYRDLKQVGRDVRDTGFFFESFVAPKKDGLNFQIRNTAPYSPILARGRKTIDGKAYGSLKWYNGLNPMLAKLEADIIKRTDTIRV